MKFLRGYLGKWPSTYPLVHGVHPRLQSLTWRHHHHHIDKGLQQIKRFTQKATDVLCAESVQGQGGGVTMSGWVYATL